MKTRMDFVTNSSTVCYLVFKGKVEASDILSEKVLGHLLDEFIVGSGLNFYYKNDPLNDRTGVERDGDFYTFKLRLDVPFDKVIDECADNLIKWMQKRKIFIEDDFERYMFAEYDG